MIIVSGLARSGTSLMMGMLRAGGIPVYTDGVRQADKNNPKGYSEIEAIGKKLAANPQYLSKQGNTSCAKVLSPFLKNLGGSHRIIYMERDIGEISASIEKMSGQPVTPRQRAALESHIENTKISMNGREVIYINYNQLVTDPSPEVEKLSHFIPELDMVDAISVIDKRLYRNRGLC